MSRRMIRSARAIVTGASGGIGRELALELARRGARVVALARREEKLAELAAAAESLDGEVRVVAGDVTDPAVRRQVMAAVQEAFGGLDLLINNAGVGAIGPFAAADEARLRRIMEVNFFAPLELTRIALPVLEQGRRPMVVNVGSVLGHRAVPQKSEYCASKFAVHGFSDALRAELAPAGIDVLLVSPSTTASEFFQNVLEDRTERPGWAARAMSPRVVARKTIRAIEQGRHEIILSSGGKLLVWLDRLCPPVMNRLLARTR